METEIGRCYGEGRGPGPSQAKGGSRSEEEDSDEEAREVLDLVRLANVTTGKPLTEDELKFIAQYPGQARKILTLSLYQEPAIVEERTRVTRKVGFPWEKTGIPKTG